MNIADIIELGVTCSSILVASASFLLGFYLSEKARGTPSNRLGLHKFIILSMAIPSILIVLPLIQVVLHAKDAYWMLSTFFLIMSLIPPVVLVGVLIRSWD